MKFKRLFIFVAFGLFSLGFNGTLVSAMELNEKKSSNFAKESNQVNSDLTNLVNMGQQSEGAIHKTLGDKIITSKIKKTEKNDENLEDQLKDCEKKFPSVSIEIKSDYENLDLGEAAFVKSKFNGEHKEINKIKEAGKVRDAEFKLEKESESFDSGSSNNMLNRKRKLDKNEDCQNSIKIESNKNRIDEIKVNEAGKVSGVGFKFEKPYESTSSKDFFDLRNEFNFNTSEIALLGLKMFDKQTFGSEFSSIFDSLKLNCPSVVAHHSRIIESFEKEESKSLERIRNIGDNSQGNIKKLLEKDLIGRENDEGESDKSTVFRPFNRFDKNFEVKQSNIFNDLKLEFNKVKGFVCWGFEEFIPKIKRVVELIEKDGKNVFENGLDKCLSEYKRELSSYNFGSEKFVTVFDSLLKTINLLTEKSREYGDKNGKKTGSDSNLFLELKNKFEEVKKLFYEKFKNLVSELKLKFDKEFGKDSDSDLNNIKEELFCELDGYLTKYEQALKGNNFDKKKIESCSLVKTIDLIMKKLHDYYSKVKSKNFNSKLPKQKMNDFLELLEKYFIARLKRDLVEVSVKTRFGENALKELNRTQCIFC